MGNTDVIATVTFFFATDGKYLCLLSIVPFVIQANVERHAYSSIYVFKHLSSSARHDFIEEVQNMGGSDEGKGNDGGTCNDVAP
jgi:hypothetical protein